MSVQETVWNWRNPGPEGGGSVNLRRQAVIQAAVMAVIGLLLHQWIGHQTFGLVIWALAAVVLILGLAAPKAYRPIHRFGQFLGKAVGGLLTWLLLVPLFFLVFFPGAIVLKLTGRDPMSLRRKDDRYTCWIPRRRAIPNSNYVRQFLLEDKAAREELRPVGSGVSPDGEAAG